VWDPSFEANLKGSLFSWSYQAIEQGVTIGLDKTEEHSGIQSLRLAFDGKHDPNLEAACTLVIVQPSTTYRLSGWFKSKALTSDKGIGLRLRTMEVGPATVVNTQSVLGTNPWTLVEQNWSSGPDIHRVQICVTRDASENPEVRISGTGWVDDVNLVLQPPEHRKP
jgi:hypothetical protein